MTDIKVGDVVRLKSGGPSMTVTHIYDAPRGGTKTDIMLRLSGAKDGVVCVVYFDENAKARKQNFAPILLKKEE